MFGIKVIFFFLDFLTISEFSSCYFILLTESLIDQLRVKIKTMLKRKPAIETIWSMVSFLSGVQRIMIKVRATITKEIVMKSFLIIVMLSLDMFYSKLLFLSKSTCDTRLLRSFSNV